MVVSSPAISEAFASVEGPLCFQHTLEVGDTCVSPLSACVSQTALPRIFAVGSLIETQEARAACLGEEYTVGECVAIQHGPSENWMLTFITAKKEGCVFEYSSSIADQRYEAPSRSFRKIETVILRALLAQFISSHQLSLPIFVQDGTETIVLKLGDQIPRECRRHRIEDETFVSGELAAVRVGKKKRWYATRVVAVAKRQIHFMHPSKSTVCHTGIEKFRKITFYPCHEPQPDRLLASPRPSVLSSSLAALDSQRIGTPVLKNVASLMEDFSKREFCLFPPEQFDGLRVYGYMPSLEQARTDSEQLLSIVRAHNVQFSHLLPTVRERPDCVGFIEELALPQDTWVFVQADLHSDLASLMGILEMWKAKGFLDERYRAMPHFHMFFLGDYVDRGANDIEVLSLLLSLHMENPQTIHLLRGNHEAVEMTVQYASHKAFLLEHEREFTTCFSTLPRAMLVCCQEGHIKSAGSSQRQYVHLSHGLFSPGVSPVSSPIGEHVYTYLPRDIVMQKSSLSDSIKTKQAAEALFEKFGNIPEALSLETYLWSDIDKVSGPSRRGAGYRLSPEDILLYRQSSSCATSKVCAFVRGHEHLFNEYFGARKVLATTLPVSRATGVYDAEMASRGLHCLIFCVKKRVKDWEKAAIWVEIDPSTHRPSFWVEAVTRTMYQSFSEEGKPIPP